MLNFITMSYSQINLLKEQKTLKWCFVKRSRITLLFMVNILCLLFRTGKSTTLLKFDLQTLGDGKLNLTCHLHENTIPIRGNNSALCNDASFDAIFTYRDETFVFKGKQYWKHINNGIAPEYPKLISQKWFDLPNNIDTAFTDNSERFIYFFKGSQYWKYAGENLEQGYPREIKTDFPGIPNDIQASAIWNGNGQLYVFKGESYWRVDLNRRPFDISQPTEIKNWLGIPGNLDDALQSPGFVTYFFKKGKYYKYNDKRESVEIDDPPYPKRVASNWFGCPKILKIIED